MSSNTRLYLVTEQNGPVRLVEAASFGQVLKHCAMPRFGIKVANSRDVAKHMAAGVKVEQANHDGDAA